MKINNIVKDSKRTLICGKDSSGKTEFLKNLVRNLSETESILVLSNHKEIKKASQNPNNVDYLYKPKDCSYVDMKFLDTDAQYIFIDELCENIEEISNKLKEKNLIFVKTLIEEISDEDKKFYDVIIQVKRDDLGMPIIEHLIK